MERLTLPIKVGGFSCNQQLQCHTDYRKPRRYTLQHHTLIFAFRAEQCLLISGKEIEMSGKYKQLTLYKAVYLTQCFHLHWL